MVQVYLATFYYLTRHDAILNANIGDDMESSSVIKGLAGGPDVPPGFYALFSARFADMGRLQAALGKAGHVLGDIPNYDNAQPTMLIGEVAK